MSPLGRKPYLARFLFNHKKQLVFHPGLSHVCQELLGFMNKDERIQNLPLQQERRDCFWRSKPRLLNFNESNFCFLHLIDSLIRPYSQHVYTSAPTIVQLKGWTDKIKQINCNNLSQLKYFASHSAVEGHIFYNSTRDIHRLKSASKKYLETNFNLVFSAINSVKGLGVNAGSDLMFYSTATGFKYRLPLLSGSQKDFSSLPNIPLKHPTYCIESCDPWKTVCGLKTHTV